jgi:S-adenosylmethionine:tRNA ribosyltransferase-isomerase
MLVSDFDYLLPPELIAQRPVEPRDSSRLMVLDRLRHTISDHRFFELPSFLESGDLLVFNDTRVIPARMYAHKDGADGAKIEVFLLKQIQGQEWECLVFPGKKVKPGVQLHFHGGVTALVLETTESGGRALRFPEGLNFHDWLWESGETPLPPYIKEKLADPERYQTIFSRHEGSVAAPTAGLHFTRELFGKIAARGVHLGFLTLHVGLGTFRPVKTELVEDHPMHSEFFTITPDLALQVRQTKEAGHRVIAVGTTAVRVLESQVTQTGEIKDGSGETAIFIYPGYRFKVIDGLVTNFHLPRSTLLMLISAFAGREYILKSYRQAVEEQYRFFSFGDAMFIS